MANNFTNDGEIQVLSYLLKGVSIKSDGFGGSSAFTFGDGNLYISLHTADPTETGGVSAEIGTTNTGYSRQSITFGAGSESSSGTGGASDPGTSMTGPSAAAGITWTASSDWATGATTVSHFGIHLGATGEMIMFGTLDNARNVANGDQVKLSQNALTVKLL